VAQLGAKRLPALGERARPAIARHHRVAQHGGVQGVEVVGAQRAQAHALSLERDARWAAVVPASVVEGHAPHHRRPACAEPSRR